MLVSTFGADSPSHDELFYELSSLHLSSDLSNTLINNHTLVNNELPQLYFVFSDNMQMLAC